MSEMSLRQIEKNVAMLSREDQLLLMERIIHLLRKKNIEEDVAIENQLTEMASDKEIQAELRQINEEFIVTEADGLGNL
jgi:hypothetical protein